MINIETLLSSFDERGTLLKWLKAVEKALSEATLTSVDVVTISTQQIQLKFNFEDGTSISTPSITLPKGDKGDKGDTGDTGAAGIGISNVTVTANNQLFVTLSNGIEINAGTINITVDSALSGTSENPVQNKVIYSALQSKIENPMTTAGDIIYGGANGDPASLPIGTAGQVLTVDNNTLKPVWANASGEKLYKHCIYFKPSFNNHASVEFITKTNSTLLYADIALLLYSLGFNSYEKCFPIAQTTNTNTTKILQGIYSENGTSINARYIQFSLADNNLTATMSQDIGYARSSGEIVDTVTEL